MKIGTNKINLRAADRLTSGFLTATSLATVLGGKIPEDNAPVYKIYERLQIPCGTLGSLDNYSMFAMFLQYTNAATNWAICQELGIGYSSQYTQPVLPK